MQLKKVRVVTTKAKFSSYNRHKINWSITENVIMIEIATIVLRYDLEIKIKSMNVIWKVFTKSPNLPSNFKCYGCRYFSNHYQKKIKMSHSIKNKTPSSNYSNQDLKLASLVDKFELFIFNAISNYTSSKSSQIQSKHKRELEQAAQKERAEKAH